MRRPCQPHVWFFFSTAAAVLACGSPGTQQDSGSVTDAGMASSDGGRGDAGNATDSGSSVDAGLDAGGAQDAGGTQDAGGMMDAGSTSDGGGTDGGMGMDAGSGGDGGACVEFSSIQLSGVCGTDSDCNCGMVCSDDLAFIASDISVCEFPCQTNADCPNAATRCAPNVNPVDGGVRGMTCQVNVCTGVSPGASCDAIGNGTNSGTCVPEADTANFAGPDRLVCVPYGTASACGADVATLQLGGNEEDPRFTVITSLVAATPFPRGAANFCPAGQACAWSVPDAGPTCSELCVPGTPNACSAIGHCVQYVTDDPAWGFCQRCGPAGTYCTADTDCCDSSAGNCSGALQVCVN